MSAVKILVGAIELDTSIQCRAQIDTATVNEYAERMTAGDKFPPILVFGSADRCWIGDGWHRVLAALQISLKKIDADLRRGNRTDALKHALSANTVHGMRRTNADKRRCVEIALREFPKLSSRAIAEMCGVSPQSVLNIRPEPTVQNGQSKRIGRDGKERPATAKSNEGSPPQEDAKHEEPEKFQEPETYRSERPRAGPPCFGMQFARIAVLNLEEIREDDAEREEAFGHVKGWLIDHGA